MMPDEYYKSYMQPDKNIAQHMPGGGTSGLQLSIAPTCNMLCNFCSRGCDCICNGNDPGYACKMLTPRQAVNLALSSAAKDKRIKSIAITGPGEPLCNTQTYEVLKQLSYKLSGITFNIGTNGLLLEEKAEALMNYGVKSVDISINALRDEILAKLYSKLILHGSIISDPGKVASIMRTRQAKGLEKCMVLGMKTGVNTVYFPGINDEDVLEIAQMCKAMGIKSMCLISGIPGGKFTGIMPPAITEMVAMQQKVSKILPEVQLKTFFG